MSAVVYTKTPKGLRESSGKSRALSKDMRELLKVCNGWFTVAEIAAQVSPGDSGWLEAAIAELAAGGYLRDVPEVWREDEKAAPDNNGLESLDFSAPAPKITPEGNNKNRSQEDAEAKRRAEEDRIRQAAEQKKRAEAVEKERLHAQARQREEEERKRRIAEKEARMEATEATRLEEEERAQPAIKDTSIGAEAIAGKLRADFASRRGKRDEATSELIKEIDGAARKKAEEKAAREAEERTRREAEERIRREVEEKLRRETEERIQREAEEKVRRDAEERARREAEERIRREVEEKLRREAEEKARREAEERARVEAEERARREAEEKLRREAEEKARREAEEKARIEAEERARREAEERARREAEERIRREVEEKLRREAEEKARLEAEERARIEAEERARREAEEALRRKEEERIRRIAEKKARQEAEEKARLEQEERDREAIKERIRQRNEKRRRIILPTFLGLVLPVLLGLLVLHFYSFEGKRVELEKIAAELFGTPVKIGSARFGVLKGPQWILENVAAGSDAETVKISRVRISTSLLGIFGTPARFDSVQLEGPQLPAAAALKLLTGTSGNALLQTGEITATGLVFAAGQGMPPLKLRASFKDGRLTTISGRGDDAEAGKLSLDMNREEQWRITLGATQVRWLLGPGLPLTDVTLKADLTPGNLQIREFSGTLFEGGLSGSGNLSWQNGWRAAAKLDAKLLDTTKFAAAWSQEGLVNGSAVIVAEAASPAELASRAKISGNFNIGRGLLAGIDLEKVAQNSGLGEQFRYESLSGAFFSDPHSMEFSDLKLVAGELKASGALSVDASRSVNGRVNLEIQTARRTASVKVGGTLTAPRYLR